MQMTSQGQKEGQKRDDFWPGCFTGLKGRV